MPMAKGTGRPCVKCYLAFALIVLIVLVATNVWNPFPGVWEWANRSEPLSEPDVLWQQRVGGSPKSVTIAGNTVVLEFRTSVEARSLDTGLRLWERRADWAAVAGGAQDPVVAVGKLLVKGYELLDPTTGAVRRKDPAAVGVWTYRDGLLDARCTEATECTLTAWEPRGATPRWSAFLPGVSTGWLADNPETLGTRRLTTERIAGDAAGPEPLPSLLGLPVDGKVHIVDTATGRAMQQVQPDNDDRIVVVGGRMLRIEAEARDGTCYFDVAGSDPANGQQVWRRPGVNLRTADGAGCVQRRDPQGGQNVLVGVAGDGREALLDGYDGRLLWVGGEGERVIAVNDRYALVRSGDGATVSGYELTVERPRWSRRVHPKGGAALSPYAAVVVDREPERIVALDPRTGAELVNLRSSAEVLAVGPGGLVIGEGRDIGYVRFVGGPRSGSGPARPDSGPAPGGAEPSCGGPKNEQCPPPDGGGKDG